MREFSFGQVELRPPGMPGSKAKPGLRKENE